MRATSNAIATHARTGLRAAAQWGCPVTRLLANARTASPNGNCPASAMLHERVMSPYANETRASALIATSHGSPSQNTWIQHIATPIATPAKTSCTAVDTLLNASTVARCQECISIRGASKTVSGLHHGDGAASRQRT